MDGAGALADAAVADTSVSVKIAAAATAIRGTEFRFT
jgi:hypothetical protein